MYIDLTFNLNKRLHTHTHRHIDTNKFTMKISPTLFKENTKNKSQHKTRTNIFSIRTNSVPVIKTKYENVHCFSNVTSVL